MDKSILLQEEIVTQINRAYINYKKSSKDRLTTLYIQTRLENLESLWKKFTDNHYDVIVATPKQDRDALPYFKEGYYESLEDIYTDYKTKMKIDLAKSDVGHSASMKVCDVSSSNVAPTNLEVKLPQIQLPSFSGSYEDWECFHDMFVSLIHTNQHLNAVQKLHYLKSSLKGEPEMLLKSLSTTEMNYDEAWDKLKRRYSNKRYNSNEVMKRLFSQKTISSESASAIKQLIDTTSACLKSLKNLGIDIATWDVIINYLVVSKLDYETRKQWETEIGRSTTDEFPTWNQLVQFLETRFRTLEMIYDAKQPVKYNVNTKQITKQKVFHSTVQENKRENKEQNKACVLCSNPHLLFQCKQFASKSPEERSEFVNTKRLCFNCFSSNHNVRNCHQSTCCRRCGRRHHTLLHIERISSQEAVVAQLPSTSTDQSSGNVTSSPQSLDYEKKVVAHFAKEEHQVKVLLATALVKVKSTNGYIQTARVLIDQGSEASLVTESIAQSLCLKRTPVNGLVTGVGDGKLKTKNIVHFEIESINNPDFSISVNAFILSSLTSFLPSSKSSILNWPDINNLPLADPHYDSPGKIDIILGVEVYSQIILSGLLKHPSDVGPVAQNTQLGWILSGKMSQQDELDSRVVSLHLQVNIDSLLKQFWEIEREPALIGRKLTKEEIKCEEIFERTTVRDNDGRYVVRLPFKESNPKCIYGRSKTIAIKRLNLLEKKLKKNYNLRVEYANVLADYLQQNHMEQIKDQKEIDNPYAVYLPHHAIVRDDRQTTKVRVVFDASCKGVNGVSLNDTLLVGPRIQQDLRHNLMRWRIKQYCVVADITQMYRQVVVDKCDTDFQRIVWRDDPDQPIQHFRLLRLTFGTSCAPYLAVKSLQQLAKDEEAKYPLAAKITVEDFYVDDMLSSCETEDEAIQIYKEMNELMKEGGFMLQKWSSNSKLP